MTFRVETIKGLTDLVMHLRLEEGGINFDDLDVETDLEGLADLWVLASAWKTAANRVEKIIGTELVRQLDGGAVDVGDLRVFAKLGYTKETCIDTQGFLGWLEANPGHAVRVINPNNVKKGSLPPGVRDTFFEKERVVKPDSEPVPVAVPREVLDKAKGSL